MGTIDLDVFAQMTSDLIGLEAWGAAVGHGSFVTMNFGRPLDDDPLTGEFFLWLYCCSWRIERGDSVVAVCEDDRERMQAGVSLLNGQRLLRIDVDAVSLSATFWFSTDIVLRTFSIYSTEVEHWMMRLPDGQWITAGPGWSILIGS